MAGFKRNAAEPQDNFNHYADRLNQRHSPEPGAKLKRDLPKLHRIRRNRNTRNILMILTPFILIGLFCIYMVSPVAKVHNITVTGTQNVANQDVIDASNITEKTYVLALHQGSAKVSANIRKQLPGVKKVTISYSGMQDVNIHVVEHATIGYVQKNKQYHIVINNGTVLKQGTSTPMQGLPIFSGFGADVHQIVRIFSAFPAAVRNDISEVDATRGDANPYQITISMNDGNRIIADSRTVLKKIKYYPSMVSQVKGTGTVDIEVGAFFVPYTSK